MGMFEKNLKSKQLGHLLKFLVINIFPFLNLSILSFLKHDFEFIQYSDTICLNDCDRRNFLKCTQEIFLPMLDWTLLGSGLNHTSEGQWCTCEIFPREIPYTHTALYLSLHTIMQADFRIGMTNSITEILNLYCVVSKIEKKYFIL